MRRALTLMGCCALAACATHAHRSPPATNWDQRAGELQSASDWQLDGRAAVAFGTQGWQATLELAANGEQRRSAFGGTLRHRRSGAEADPSGLSLNGAPPSDAVLSQLQEQLGFELPLDNLRFWLLGVPNPDSPFELTRNDQDRAKAIEPGRVEHCLRSLHAGGRRLAARAPGLEPRAMCGCASSSIIGIGPIERNAVRYGRRRRSSICFCTF